MLRERLSDSLKSAMKQHDTLAVSTLRLILTAIKDRDIAARGKGVSEGVDEREILDVLQTMVKQRREAIRLYEQGGRLELAEQEAGEIRIIEDFLPQQLSQDEMQGAVRDLIAELGAASLKDMGRTMATMRERYAGRMDFGAASAYLKEQLSKA